MTRLLLVRHGETVDNVNKIMQGQTHGRLTLNGIEQAHELGRQLIWQGPLRRWRSLKKKRTNNPIRYRPTPKPLP